VGVGGGVLFPGLLTSKAAIVAAVPFIALGGGAVMALAYAVLMALMREEERGALTGLYSTSRGIGLTDRTRWQLRVLLDLDPRTITRLAFGE